jgi:hypothetical protein
LLLRIGKTNNPYTEPIFQRGEEDESLLLDSLFRLREFGDAAACEESSRILTLAEKGASGSGKNRIKVAASFICTPSKIPFFSSLSSLPGSYLNAKTRKLSPPLHLITQGKSSPTKFKTKTQQAGNLYQQHSHTPVFFVSWSKFLESTLQLPKQQNFLVTPKNAYQSWNQRLWPNWTYRLSECSRE